MLKVNEIFYSIQGEGMCVGSPMIFVRFSECNLKCPWCDTNHQRGTTYLWDELRAKIAKLSEKTGCKTICLTGGEPLYQKDFTTLCDSLCDKYAVHSDKYAVHIETNGTYALPPHLNSLKIENITVSPKRETGFKNLLLSECHAIKFIVDDKMTKQELKKAIAESAPDSSQTVYLQPAYGSDLAMEKTIRWVKEGYGLLSIQIHKILKIK